MKLTFLKPRLIKAICAWGCHPDRLWGHWARPRSENPLGLGGRVWWFAKTRNPEQWMTVQACE